MLVCVSILCTCFIAYISRTDWRKAAEEVTCAPAASRPASGKGPRGLGWNHSGMRQHHGLDPTGQCCPGLSPPVPPVKPSAPVTVATSLYSILSHMCTQWPQGFPLHLVPPLVGDMKHKADGVTEATSTLSIPLCPNSSGVSTSQRLSFGASFSYTVPFPARRTL